MLYLVQHLENIRFLNQTLQRIHIHIRRTFKLVVKCGTEINLLRIMQIELLNSYAIQFF